MPVAKELKKQLAISDLLSPREESGRAEFWTSGNQAEVRARISQLWSKKIQVFKEDDL